MNNKNKGYQYSIISLLLFIGIGVVNFVGKKMAITPDLSIEEANQINFLLNIVMASDAVLTIIFFVLGIYFLRKSEETKDERIDANNKNSNNEF